MKRPLPTYSQTPSTTTYCGTFCRYSSSGKYEEPRWGSEPRHAESPTPHDLPRYISIGLSYFGVRYYDADLLTGWLSVDPMADKYPTISPYAYCAWNPIGAIDPNGMDSIKTPNGMANAGTGYKATPDGLFLYGDGLQPKRWNPSLEIGAVVGLQGGYENYTPYESVSSSFASFNPQPIAVEGLTPPHDFPTIFASNTLSGLFHDCRAGGWLQGAEKSVAWRQLCLGWSGVNLCKQARIRERSELA